MASFFRIRCSEGAGVTHGCYTAHRNFASHEDYEPSLLATTVDVAM